MTEEAQGPMLAEVHKVCSEVGPLLHGRHPTVQGMVLGAVMQGEPSLGQRSSNLPR